MQVTIPHDLDIFGEAGLVNISYSNLSVANGLKNFINNAPQLSSNEKSFLSLYSPRTQKMVLLVAQL